LFINVQGVIPTFVALFYSDSTDFTSCIQGLKVTFVCREGYIASSSSLEQGADFPPTRSGCPKGDVTQRTALSSPRRMLPPRRQYIMRVYVRACVRAA